MRLIQTTSGRRTALATLVFAGLLFSGTTSEAQSQRKLAKDVRRGAMALSTISAEPGVRASELERARYEVQMAQYTLAIPVGEQRAGFPRRTVAAQIRRAAKTILATGRLQAYQGWQLTKARDHLRRAHRIVMRQGTAPSQPHQQQPMPAQPATQDYFSSTECARWAYPEYQKAYSSATAWDKAQSSCNDAVNLGIAQYLYPAYASAYSAGTAMDKALQKAQDRRLDGKQWLLNFSVNGYRQSYSGGTAADKASQVVAGASNQQWQCVRDSFNAIKQSYGAGTAMDQAFQRCR